MQNFDFLENLKLWFVILQAPMKNNIKVWIESIGTGTGIPAGTRGPSCTLPRTGFEPERAGILSDRLPGFFAGSGSRKGS